MPSNNAFLYNLFTPQLSISYAPDVFGLNRRTVESLQAQEQATRFQTIATYTTLTSNVVVTAVQEAATRAQIEATRQLIDDDAQMLSLLQYQRDKGYASDLDLAGQQSQLAQAKATLPPLIKQEAQLRDQLAVLTGRFPSQLPEQQFELSDLHLPQRPSAQPALRAGRGSGPTSARRKRTCTRPARRSASPPRTAFPTSR